MLRSWLFVSALLLGLCTQRALTEVEGSSYQVEVHGDEISIFEIMRDDDGAVDALESEEADEEEEEGWSSVVRSLLAKKKTVDCRKPKNKKKKKCRQPSKKTTSPPPPKRSPPPPPRPRSPPPPRPSPPPPSPDEYVYEAPSYNPVPVPKPPPPAPVTYNQVRCDYTPRRRILSGPRMVPNGGLRACTGLHVASAGDCCEVCRGTVGCNGWMYSRPLDCRMFGENNPQNVCYMLSDVSGSYDPIIGELEYFSGTANY